MAFPGLPETSKMYIFASIVYHLRTNNINIYVSKIYSSGLIFGMLIGFHIWGRIFEGEAY